MSDIAKASWDVLESGKFPLSADTLIIIYLFSPGCTIV